MAATTSRDAYPSMMAYATNPRLPYPENPRLVFDRPQQPHAENNQITNIYTSQRVSPDPAVNSYPFADQALNQSSSASAASIASAASSNRGSPYHGALPVMDDGTCWTGPHPGIVPADGFTAQNPLGSQFAPDQMEYHMMFTLDKSADHYVGECSENAFHTSAESPSPAMLSFSPTPSSVLSPLPPCALYLHQSPLVGRAKPYHPLDTNSGLTTTPLPMNEAVTPRHSSRAIIDRADSPSRMRSISAEPALFRSPTTPASACQSPFARSAVDAQRRGSLPTTSRINQAVVNGLSPTGHVMLRSSPEISHCFPVLPSPGPHTSLLFRQSSGNFVLPLHSSCRFPSSLFVFLAHTYALSWSFLRP